MASLARPAYLRPNPILLKLLPLFQKHDELSTHQLVRLLRTERGKVGLGLARLHRLNLLKHRYEFINKVECPQLSIWSIRPLEEVYEMMPERKA